MSCIAANSQLKPFMFFTNAGLLWENAARGGKASVHRGDVKSRTLIDTGGRV